MMSTSSESSSWDSTPLLLCEKLMEPWEKLSISRLLTGCGPTIGQGPEVTAFGWDESRSGRLFTYK